jgi:hypothetical protein
MSACVRVVVSMNAVWLGLNCISSGVIFFVLGYTYKSLGKIYRGQQTPVLAL